MKVFSIGPMTRDTKIPEGRTVPKETYIHLGRMCDTYGLSAIPGFSQKVCPTSGALVNQMFWAVCMEIAEEIISKTGNTPCVLRSSALKTGRPHNKKMEAVYAERGY